ncbi:FimV/HubP family polar landmark protein [Oceanobacter antarcticus]|uniref:FimV/HubP family polar landmark protein n=1 Tax=Oceanobacter antarcticus TaxID=3133425 RepID=A0ABW8NG55_9GAMM
MKRLFANALLLVGSLTMSTQLLALGLGELTLKSALNQPLAAEIALVDSEGLSEWEIKPVLASTDAFERYSVERSYFLTKIKFKVVGDKIVLATREAVTEPFLNFLVELNWPSGRVVREFTVLLDPPTFAEESFRPLVSAPTATASSSATAPVPAATPAARPAAATRDSTGQWQSQSAEPGTYMVQPNDTLWAISLATRPDTGVTPQQMMMAIQQHNPDAFIGGNINRLKTHQVLRIPDPDQIHAISFESAVSEVARQNQAIAGTAQLDATGRAAVAPSSRASSTGGEVRLVSDRGEQSDSAGASGEVAGRGNGRQEVLENDLAIALETLDKSRRDNADLADRLTALEEQIAALQRLVSLKDDQLANMQVNAAQQPADKSVVVAPASQPDMAQPAEVAGAVERAVPATETSKSALAEVKPQPAPEPKPEMAERPKPRVVPAPRPEPDLVDSILQDPITLGGVLAAILLLIALIYTAVKKRLGGGSKQEESLETATAAQLQDEMADAAAPDTDDFDQFSFGHENDDSDTGVQLGADLFSGDDALDISIDSFDTRDKLLTEVDADIAYGRFDEALSKLTPAIEAQPDRSDLSLKLLEVLSELDDASAFADEETRLLGFASDADVSEAEQLRFRLTSPMTPVTDSDFDSISLDDLDMEFKNDLDDSFDITDTDADATDAGDVEKDAEKDVDIMPVLGADAMDFEAALAEGDDGNTQEDDGLDFSLDSLAGGGHAEIVDEVTISDDDQGLDFDLSAFDDDEEITAEPAGEASEPEHENLMDFDVSDDLLEELAEATPAAEEPATLSGDNVMEFDLDGLDIPELGEEEAVEEPAVDDGEHSLEFEVPELNVAGEDVTLPVASHTIDEAAELALDEFDLSDFEAELDTAELADPDVEEAVTDASGQQTSLAGLEEDADDSEPDLDLAELDNELEMLASVVAEDDTAATSTAAAEQLTDTTPELADETLMEFDLDSLEAELDALDSMADLPKLSEADLTGVRLLVGGEEDDQELPELDDLEEFGRESEGVLESTETLAAADSALDDFDLATVEDDVTGASATTSLEQLEPLEDLPELADLEEELPEFDFEELPELEEVSELESAEAAAVEELPQLDELEDLAFELDDAEALPDLAELEDFTSDESNLADVSDADASDMDIPSFTADSIDLDELAETEDEFAYLSGTDASDTKLDLARAYVDMGEADSARELLNEIVQEGSDQQKQDAQNLLDSLI